MWDAKLYNEKHSFVFDYGESLIDLLDSKQDETILDLGCGAGQLTFKISERAKEVIGLDNSPEMIDNARAHFPHLDFQVCYAATKKDCSTSPCGLIHVA